MFASISWAQVAHTCNPSYSEGRDQEDHGFKSARASSSQDPISKNPITKNWAGGVAQGEGPEFKPQYHKKKKKKERKNGELQVVSLLVCGEFF
jgi:hypothetical protein